MTEPWIEATQSAPTEDEFGQGYNWQASFAVALGVPRFSEWEKMKWGFNAAALMEETLERQRVFIESRHVIDRDLQIEYPQRRTFSIRFISLPGKGLMPVVMGMTRANSPEEARQTARDHLRELRSTLPYDYQLYPAATRDEYERISGERLGPGDRRTLQLIQIKRSEMPYRFGAAIPFLQGVWESTARAHELIWRVLSAMPNPSMLCVTLRPTVLYEREMETLWEVKNQEKPRDQKEPGWISLYRSWSGDMINRRLTPWKKLYYLQVFLVSSHPINEDVARSIGAALTMGSGESRQPGYQIVRPEDNQRKEWLDKLFAMDILFTGSRLPVPRLSEIADHTEAVAVIRFPYYPPDRGLPGVNFIHGANDQP